ncbi:50S ribosomal protein L11 methyltransferase [Phytohabitans houttuyneae]|nr:50S ribosomal protein L11 methyltransferase [Phytohabitans houttuyneae]
MDQRLLLMHQVMLGDRPRLRAYDRALEQAVKPDDVVIDVGAGTLALSLLALRHGAGHVYAIEADPQMAEVAERVVKANDLTGRVTLIQGDARAVRLPERADVLVAELMGNLGPEEAMSEVVGAVARRNLRPEGRVVPSRLRTWLVPVQFDNEGWGLWQDDFFGYRLDAVAEDALAEAHMHFFQREPALLADPVAVVDSRLGGPPADPPRLARVPVTRSGRLDAILGYFSADLGDETLANFPSYPGCNWAVWVWPLRHTTVEAGDEVRMQIRPPARGQARLATQWRLDCGINRQGR